jgi:prephenate dehydrogenase
VSFDGLRIGILGVGQTGGSLAAALKASARDVTIVGFDLDEALLAEAKSRGILDRAVGSETELIERSDIVVLATPVGTIVDTIERRVSELSTKKLVTDVGSVMGQIVAAADRAGLGNFVGGHPLAGTERRGAQAWDNRLFEGAVFFMSETTETTGEAKALLIGLIEAVGSVATDIRADQHDRVFATASNLPHVFAFLLRQAFDGKRGRFANPSFRSATRVADSDPEMVFQMLWYNREALVEALGSMSTSMAEVQDALTEGDAERFRRVLGL